MRLDSERYRETRRVRLGFLARRLLRLPTLDRTIYADSDLTAAERRHLEDVTRSVQRVFSDRKLLFIYGVMPRSGTNFLYEMLLRLPSFERSPIGFAELPILAGEDYFQGPHELIGRVHAESGAAFGRMEWMANAVGGFRNRLLDIATPGSTTLIKNPVVWNIELWPILFPQDRALFIMRDARYIVDSFHRTFARRRLSRTFEDICIETALAYQKSERFLTNQPANKLLRIRYEDAVAAKARVAGEILAWLGMDAEPAHLRSVESVPVFGSSTHSRMNGAVDWTPVQADTSFDPTGRPLDWTPAQRRQFERICGDINARMGYPSS